MKEKETKEPKKKGYNLNDLGVDQSNTQPEKITHTRDKSLFPPISELIKKKPFVKDEPNKSIKEDKVKEEQEVKEVKIQDNRRECNRSTHFISKGILCYVILSCKKNTCKKLR